MQQAALHAAAHVQLQLGNHLAALRHATSVLRMPQAAAADTHDDVRRIAAECLALAGSGSNAVAAFLERAVRDAADEPSGLQSNSTAGLLRCAASMQIAAGGAQSLQSAAQHARKAQLLQPDSHAAALLAIQVELLAGNTTGALQLVEGLPGSHTD